ncbi:MAG TPA: hypothetical protein VGP07_03360 [Polyangia bacterium]
MRSTMFTLLGVLAGLSGSRAAHAADTTTIVQTALEAATTIPNARVSVVALERGATNCTMGIDPRAEVPRAVDGSGRFAVKLIGTRSGSECQAWIWARVRVFAQVSVATRAIRAGDPFAGATETVEREIKAGRTPAASVDGAVADRPLGPGQMIEADVVRVPGLRSGETVKVLLVAGGMSIEQMGRAVPCARNHNCAVLPSGRHVDGTLVDGRLLVEMP